MKINAVLLNGNTKDAPRAPVIFQRPPNAVTWRGSVHLFTLPSIPGMLFKEVSGYQEAEDLDCGIAYSSQTGESVIVLVGGTATDCKGVDTRFSAMHSYLGEATGEGSVSVPGLVQFNPTYDSADSIPGIAIGPRFRQMLRDEYKLYATGYPHLRPELSRISIMDANPAPYFELVHPSMTAQSAYLDTEILEYAFSPVCRASNGAVLKPKNFHVFGWISTICPLGEGFFAMQSSVDKMVADAPDEAKSALAQAFKELTAEGEYIGLTKSAIVTYYGSPVNPLPEPLVGVGYAVPFITPSGGFTPAGDPTRIIIKGGPTSQNPVMFPTVHMSALPGITDKLGPQIGAWHRMATAARGDGLMKPLPSLPPGLGDWSSLTLPIEAIKELDTSFEDTIATPIPVDPDELAAYNPTIVSPTESGPTLDVFYLDFIHGDLVPYYHNRVQRIYQRAEQIAKRSS